MNTTEISILSQQSREILIDFFINEKNKPKKFNSRKYFEKLLIQKEKYINRYWDENHTIVNYLLSHKDFKLSKSILKELYKVTQDWSSSNEEGENSLFFLIKKDFDMKDINLLIQEYQIEHNVKNKEGLFFVNYFLREEIVENIIKDYEKGINNFPEIRLNKYLSNYLDCIEKFEHLFKQTYLIEKNKFEKIKHILNQDRVKNFNKNKIGVILENTIIKIDKTFLYLSLDNKFIEKNIKTKKLKI